MAGNQLSASSRSRSRHPDSAGNSAAVPSSVLLITLAVLAGLIASRFWLADALPLTDTTEARYGEMARKMVETGNWLMPQQGYGVPYLAKPPFAFWLSSSGIELLGVNELAVRLPIILWSLAFCALFYAWLKGLFGQARALAGVLMLTSTMLFFVSMAAVMTDMVLTACVSAALIAFWGRQHGGRGSVEAAMYVLLGIGLLTKGPLAAVLFLAPVAAWSASTGQIHAVWHRFSWIRGGLLVAAVAFPWYAAAEWRYPGFLEYFIVGEHLGRFLIPGWSGDLYGFAHEVPRGTIWLFYLVALLPWTVLLVPVAISGRSDLRQAWRSQGSLLLFALFWAAAPLLLFSFSANIIWPYALPAVPGTVVALLALLTADEHRTQQVLRLGWLAAVMLAVGAVLLEKDAALVDAHTKKHAVEMIRARHPEPSHPIFYWGSQFFSAEFYSQGKAVRLEDLSRLENLLATNSDFSLLVRTDRVGDLPSVIRSRLEPVAEVDGATLLEPLTRSAEDSPRVPVAVNGGPDP